MKLFWIIVENENQIPETKFATFETPNARLFHRQWEFLKTVGDPEVYIILSHDELLCDKAAA